MKQDGEGMEGGGGMGDKRERRKEEALCALRRLKECRLRPDPCSPPDLRASGYRYHQQEEAGEQGGPLTPQHSS